MMYLPATPKLIAIRSFSVTKISKLVTFEIVTRTINLTKSTISGEIRLAVNEKYLVLSRVIT